MALQINNRSPPVLLKHNERTMPQWVSEQSDRVGPKPPPPPPSPNLSKNLKNSQPLLPPKAKIQPEPDYEVIEFSQQQYSNAPLMTSSSGSSGAKTPDVKSKCTLCGSNNSWVTCEECAQQIFCTSCDDMFHKHPKRKNHIRKALEQCRPPLPPKTIPGQGGQLPPVAPPRRNKRGILTPLMQRKDQVNNCFGVRPAHTAPCSPLPSLRNNDCFHETDLDSSKNGSNIMNRPLPATPKTSTSQVMDNQSSRSNTPKSVFDSIQRPPSVTLEKIKTKANATLDRMQLLQQRYRHQKEHIEKEHDEIRTNKQNHSPFEHWSNISSSPSHFRSGSISSGVNSSHLDLTDDSHFNLFNPHQMPQNESRNNHLTAGGLSTSVFNLHQTPLPRKSSIQGNSWIHGLPPAQSISQLNCIKCNHTQHKPPQWSPNPGMVPIAYDPWSNQLNRQQNLNRSNLSLNVPGGYIIHHPIHQNMYPPPVFLNQNGLMTHMYPAPAHMGSMGSITNADIVGVPPVPSRSGSRMASPALSRKSVTLRRKQIQCFNNELTDDEGSDEDDRRSMISNRSGFSRYRQRRLSSASQYQVNKESESGHNRPHRQRFRDQRRNFPIRQQQINDWNSNKITSSSNSGRFLDSDFNSSIMSSRIYSDLDSEGSGTKALVQAKIEQKLKEEDQKKTKNKIITKTTKHTTGVQTSPIKLKTSQNSEEDAGESEILDKKGNKESLRKQKLEQSNHEENKEKDIDEEEATLLGPPPATPDYEWECEFCTFVNEADIKICSVCCKTPSKQPKKFGTNVARAQQLSSEEHGMLKTQTVNNTINKTDCNFDKTNAQEGSHDTRGSHTPGKQESLGDIWATLDENIQNTAQEVNRKTQTVSTNNDAILPVEHQEENTLVSNIAPLLSGNTRKNLNEASSMLESTTFNATSSTNFNGNIHRLHKQYRSSVDLHCENSLPHTTDGVIYRNGMGRRQPSLTDLRLTSKVSPLNPYSSITDRMPESIVHNIAPTKGTDLYKYTPEELNAALKYSGPNVHPLMWLQEHWPKLVTTVQSLATKYGQERIENTIGTISQMEARDALRLHTGNIWQAVTECIEERQRKYREISNAGNFSREDIVTALTIHQGNVDLVLRDLERSQLKPFLMRIWGSPGGVENESGVLKQVNKTTTASQPSLNISKDIHDFLSVHVPECKPPPNTIEACHSNPSNATAHNNLSYSHMPDNTFNCSGFNKDFIPSCLQIDESILNNNNVLEDLETLIGRIEQQQQHKTTEKLPTTIENEYDQEVQRVLTKSPIRMSKFKGPSKPKNELKQSDDVKNFMWQHIQEIVPNLVEQVEKELLSESNAPIKDPPPPPVDHDEFLLEEVIKPNLKIATIKEELSPTYKYAAEIDTFRMTFDKAIEKECSTCCVFQSIGEATKQVFYLYPSHATESNTVHTEVPSGIDQKGKEITSNQSEDALIFTITEELPSTSNSNYISKPISKTKSHSSIPVNSGRKAPPFKRATQSLTPEPSSDQFKLEKSNLSGTISGEVFKMQRKINEVEIEATTPEITSSTTENEKFNSKSKKLSKIPIRKTMNSKDFRTIFTNGQTPRTVQDIKKATENENELLMQKLPTDPNGQENIFTEKNVADTVDIPNSSEVVLMIQHVPTAPDISLAPATSTSTLHSLSSNSSDVKRTSNEFLLSSDSSKQNLTDLVKDTQRLIQQMRDEISLNDFVTSEESDLYTDEYDTDEYDDEDGYEEHEDDEVWVDDEEYNKEEKNAENINTNMQPGERELFEYISDSNSSELYEVKEKFIDNSASTELSILSKSLTNDHIKHNVNPENKFTFPVLINNTYPNKFPKDDNHEGPSISISSSNNLGKTESMHQDGDHNSSIHLNTISSHLLENNKESGLSHNFETVDDTDREYFNKKNSFTISESSKTAELDEKSRKTSKSHNNIAESLTDNHTSESSNNEENFSQLSQNAIDSFENNVHTKRNNPKYILDGFHKSILNDNHIPQQPEDISNDHVIENGDHDIEHFVGRSALSSESNESKLSIIFVPLKESVSHISVCHILNSNLETENNHHDWLHNSDKQNAKSSLVSMDEQVLTKDMTMDRNCTKSPRNVHEFPGQKVLESNEQNLPLHSEIKDNSKISTLSEGLYDHTKPELTLIIDCLPSSSKMARENLAKLQQQKLPSSEQLTHNNIASIDLKPQESTFQTDSKFLENTPITKFPPDSPTSPSKFIAAENVQSVKLPGETSPPEHIPGSSSKAEKDKQSVKIQVKQSSKIPKPKEVNAKEQKFQIKKNLNTRSKSFSGPPPPVGITSVKTLRQELLKQTQKLTKSTSLQKQPPPLFVRKKSITDAITKLTKPTSNETYSNSKLFLSKSRTQPRIPKKKYHETCFSEDDYESSASETEQSESWEMRQRKLSVPVFRTYPNIQTETDTLQTEELIEKFLKEELVTNLAEAQIAAALVSMKFKQDVSLWAAKECSELDHAIALLQQECELCNGIYPLNEIVSMLKCTHKCCKDCAKNFFTIQITERSINDCNCPFCKLPELHQQNEHEDENLEYFSNLDIFLKSIVNAEVHELFQLKLRDRTLLKDPNFKWCVQCSSGFFARPKQKRLICPDCGSVTCALCRKTWQKQHENISCEQFTEWLQSNDPDAQTLGIQQHLENNGIDCPKCKFRYSLSRGGCMHFTCTQCKFEFCYGCARPFMMGAKCNISSYCAKLGLHAHHPRNCLFYLRDKLPIQLQILLRSNGVKYEEDCVDTLGAEVTNSTKKTNRCPIPIQKETPSGLVDTVCNNDVPDKHAGLCRNHYVEYLTAKVAKANIDPLPIFDLTDCVQELRRRGIALPERGPWDTDEIYTNMCAEVIKQNIPLDAV